MKTLQFYGSQEGKEAVIESLTNFLIDTGYEAEWLAEASELSPFIEEFNIEVVTYNDGVLIDYKIFDPFHIVFKGYTNFNGWSHWQNDAFPSLSDDDKSELAKLGYEI